MTAKETLVKATKTALRVLCAITDHKEPDPADVQELKLLNPRPDAPPDEIACEVVALGIRRFRTRAL